MSTRQYFLFIFLFFPIKFIYTQVWGPPLVPVLEFVGQAYQRIDFVGSIGDLNHDGYSDIAVSHSDYFEYQIFYGGQNPDAIPDLKLYGGTNVIVAGDINGNGEIDLVCRQGDDPNSGKKYGVYLDVFATDTIADYVIKLPAIDEEDGNIFNIALADINNDSLDEIMVSDVNYQFPFGAVWIYAYHQGSIDTIPTYKIIGDYTNNKNLGRSIATGDVNGDGLVDLIVHGRGGGQYDKGYINIYFGGTSFDTIPDMRLGGTDTLDFAPDGYVLVMDINGDDKDDIIIPTLHINNAYVFYGGTGLDSIPDFIFYSPVGHRPANAGDVNHDGYKDIVFGNNAALGGAGAIIIYYGGAHLDTIPDGAIGGLWMSGFGYTVAGAGRFNGDDRDDIVAGGPGDGLGNTEGMFGVYTDTSHVISIHETIDVIKPNDFELYQNYPNPFNGNTMIPYYLSKSGNVELMIYNVIGQPVKTLIKKYQEGNKKYEVEWDGKNDRGQTVSSGIYIYQLKYNGSIKSHKLNLIK